MKAKSLLIGTVLALCGTGANAQQDAQVDGLVVDGAQKDLAHGLASHGGTGDDAGGRSHGGERVREGLGVAR